MNYSTEDVFVYQIMDVLVTQYDYKIVNVPRSKKDIWLAKEGNHEFPMIRLNAECTSSSLFERDYLEKIKSALSFVLQHDSRLLIINTNKESVSFIEEDMMQVVMTDELISDSHIFEIFPALHNVLHKVSDNKNECARLTRHLETVQMRKQRAQRFSWKNIPKVSLAISIIAIVAFALLEFIRQQCQDYTSVAPYVVGGAYYKAFVYHLNEYWRFLTTGWIHLDIIILLFYIMILFQIGRICEKEYGRLKYTIIFLVSLVIGNVFPYLFEGNCISMGMGPGIFGILAALLFQVWRKKSYQNPIIKMQINQIILICLISMMYNSISIYALVGGFITGLFIAILCSKDKKVQPYRIHFGICALMILAILGYGFQKVDSAYPQLDDVDDTVIKEYRALGLDGYADYIEKSLKTAYEE